MFMGSNLLKQVSSVAAVHGHAVFILSINWKQIDAQAIILLMPPSRRMRGQHSSTAATSVALLVLMFAELFSIYFFKHHLNICASFAVDRRANFYLQKGL